MVTNFCFPFILIEIFFAVNFISTEFANANFASDTK